MGLDRESRRGDRRGRPTGGRERDLGRDASPLPRLPAGHARGRLPGRRDHRRGSGAGSRLADRGRRGAAAEPRLPPRRARVDDPPASDACGAAGPRAPGARPLRPLPGADAFRRAPAASRPERAPDARREGGLDQRREDLRHRLWARDPGLGLGRAPRPRRDERARDRRRARHEPHRAERAVCLGARRLRGYTERRGDPARRRAPDASARHHGERRLSRGPSCSSATRATAPWWASRRLRARRGR